jgi:serine/threonine protein kinase
MTIAKLTDGTRLKERFEIKRFLSSGGFAITYLAKDHEAAGARDTVVIKEHARSDVCYRDTKEGHVWPHQGKEDLHRRLCDRFKREAELLATVSHPHVVHVHFVWEERGTAYIAMEALEGATLAETPEAAPAPWSDARWGWVRTVTLQLASALEAAHNKFVYHCDVKPSNVLVTPSGVVLIDFGAARTLEQAFRTVTMIPFTPGYAAPELHSPKTVAQVGPATDIYALGMIVYGLVLGHPDDGVPLNATARSKGPDPYQSAAKALEEAGLPRRWAEAIHACIALEQTERPQTIADLRRRLGEETSEDLGRPLPTLADGAGSKPPESAESDGPRIPPPPSTSPKPQTELHRHIGLGLLTALVIVPATFLIIRCSYDGKNPTPIDPSPVMVVTQEPDPTEFKPRPSIGSQCVEPYYYECNGTCQRVRDWVFQCGRCAKSPCELPNTENYDCVQRACFPKACKESWGNCDQIAENGCETDLQTSAQHCSKCGNECKPTANVSAVACVKGACAVGACKDGFQDCNGNFLDGCEVNIVAGDVANCGGCGVKCARANAEEYACAASKCEVKKCSSPWENCNLSHDDGCEVDLKQSAENCGACGATCLGKPGARGGACVNAQCKVECTQGFDNCNTTPDDGCEIDLTISADNCGACGNICMSKPNVASATCDKGSCSLVCKPGFENCSGGAQDGCETNTMTTPDHCGGCGKICGSQNVETRSCVNGACVLTCQTTHRDADGNTQNGCEEPIPPPQPPPPPAGSTQDPAPPPPPSATTQDSAPPPPPAPT